MNPDEILPREIWGEVISRCRPEDASALVEVFGSLARGAIKEIYDDETAEIWNQVKSITTVPPYLGKEFSFLDIRRTVNEMKDYCAKYDGIPFDDWLSMVTGKTDHTYLKTSNRWTVVVWASRGGDIIMEENAKHIQDDFDMQILDSKYGPYLNCNLDQKRIPRATMKWLMESNKELGSLDPVWRSDTEIMTHACKYNPGGYRWVMYPARHDLGLVISVISIRPTTINDIPYYMLEEIISAKPEFFEYCNDSIKLRRELVEIVAEKDPSQLHRVPKSFWGDYEYSVKLYRRFPEVFAHLSEAIRGIFGFALSAVLRNPSMYAYCTGMVRENKELVEIIAEKDPSQLRHVPESFWKNSRYSMKLFQRYPEALAWLPESVRKTFGSS